VCSVATATQAEEANVRLEDKVAVITGAASGMGRAATERFCREGARVVAADMNEANGKQLLVDLEAAGYSDAVRFVRADVSVEDDVAAAIGVAVGEFGGLDIMFNNAGVGGVFGPITDIAVEDWDWTFGVLCRGVFLGIKHAARVMIDQDRGGAIVNTASVAGLSAGSGPQAYSAAKAAVINLTRVAARELAPKCIRVNAICPGAINTPLLHRGNADAMAPMLERVQPWPGVGEARHIADAALFLASDEAEFVTGEALVVDGGLMAGGPNLFGKLGADLSAFGLRGVSRGSTGEAETLYQ
jgi:NAD(P)-dependent dehydrogenase (short-subunit alcohol dehydrogenase family)